MTGRTRDGCRHIYIYREREVHTVLRAQYHANLHSIENRSNGCGKCGSFRDRRSAAVDREAEKESEGVVVVERIQGPPTEDVDVGREY